MWFFCIYFLLVTFLNFIKEGNGVDPPKPKLEYDGWKGKGGLGDNDMVEIGNWVNHLVNSTQFEHAFKYYWVNNEIMYPYSAIVRGMFSAFHEGIANKTTKPISQQFLDGAEAIVHYALLKSFPILGRKGGVRGSGQDKVILKGAIPPLVACYKKLAPSKNFTDVFPASRRRRKRRAHFHFHKKSKRRIPTRRQKRFTRGIMDDKDSLNSIERSRRQETPAELPGTLDAYDTEGNGTETNKMKIQGRYAFTLNHGTGLKAKNTNVVVADDDDGKLENIGITIFWLIFELLPSMCPMGGAEKAYKDAFEKIVGLVLSMHLYDLDDFSEEYERIFQMPVKKFESEWETIEGFAKKMQKEKKLALTKPYSDQI